jgi:hypothetical protein
LLHTFDELTTGIAELEPDVFVVFTTNAYTTHENYMHRLDLRGWTPGAPVKLELIFTFPKATLALNGCCARFRPRRSSPLIRLRDRSGEWTSHWTAERRPRFGLSMRAWRT